MLRVPPTSTKQQQQPQLASRSKSGCGILSSGAMRLRGMWVVLERSRDSHDIIDLPSLIRSPNWRKSLLLLPLPLFVSRHYYHFQRLLGDFSHHVIIIDVGTKFATYSIAKSGYYYWRDIIIGDYVCWVEGEMGMRVLVVTRHRVWSLKGGR